MASLFFEEMYRRYRVRFEYAGQSYNRSLGKAVKTDDQADEALLRVERTLSLLSDGVIEMPADVVDPGKFILSGGKDKGQKGAASVRTVEELFRFVVDSVPAGTREANTEATAALHRRHLTRLLGARTPLRGLRPADLQRCYVNVRKEESFRDKIIHPRTIRKEIATLRADWNVARQLCAIEEAMLAPTRGLHFPKDPEKPPFQTREEIEASISQGGLFDEYLDDFWDSLFFRVPEIEEVLRYVQARAAFPFILPMFAFVAYTGARRSEMMRSEKRDIDFGRGRVALREKKKDRTKKITFRYVELAAPLARILREWFDQDHPGGHYTICQPLTTRMKRRSDWVPLTRNEAKHHFRKTLEGSRWEVVPGFHCFRHSFASNAAAKGISPAQIDEWMGHQTEEMRKRYRHLFPEQRRAAIDSLFGG